MSDCKDQAWLNEYEELMFGEHHTEETMTRAAEMKAAHMPELLFKYRSCSAETFTALEEDYLYSAQPKLFNDPFEGPISILRDDVAKKLSQTSYSEIRSKLPFMPDHTVSSCQELVNCINTGMAHLYGVSEQERMPPDQLAALASVLDHFVDGELQKIIDGARNMYNICCFSAINDGTSMWEHYADHHQGFCVGYGIKNLDNTITHCTFPVLYRSDCQLHIHDLEEINGSIGMHMLTIKTTDWSCEQEWRTLFESNPPCHLEHMPLAKVVYLGYKIGEEHQTKLHDICVQKGISLFKMKPEHSLQRLVPFPLYIKNKG